MLISWWLVPQSGEFEELGLAMSIGHGGGVGTVGSVGAET